MPKTTQADIEVLAQTLYGEARGSTHDDRCAVAWVIRNRAERAARYKERTGQNHVLFGDGTFAAACHARKQFSCWNEGDPNRPLLLRLKLSGALDDRAYQECLFIALGVVLGRIPNPIGRCLHYHTATTTPSWAKGVTPYGRIGGHLFYDNIP
jgi:spore germination cell wall hydrolase CwlJ-like protein